MFKVCVIILIGIGGAASAHEHDTDPTPAPQPTPIVVTAPSTASAGASAAASADSTATAGSQANNAITFKRDRQAVAAATSASNTTAACQKDRRLGVGSVFGGLSVGASRTDRDCALLAAADRELVLGNVLASVRLRCATKVYRDALGDDCAALLEQQPVVH